MPSYTYQAYSEGGKCAEGSIDAPSEQAARDMLWRQGLIIFDIREGAASNTPWWRRELFPARRHSQLELANFTREFATLATAGVPLETVLRILSEQTSSPKLRALADELRADVLDGNSLSGAMTKHSTVFDAGYVSLIKAGEIGGHVDRVLDELAALLERRAEVRAQIRSALLYPSILLVLSVASLAVILGILIPNIAPLLTEAGRSPPAAIAVMLNLHAHWAEILTALTAVAAAGFVAMRFALRKPEAQILFDKAKLRLPLFGALLLKLDTARFIRTLGTLLRAGVPLLQATLTAHAAVNNRFLSVGLELTIQALREGAPLHQALRDNTVIPPSTLHLIAIGETAGRLAEMLLRVAGMLERQTQRTVDRSMTLLAPAMTLTVAIFAGVVIMAVMNAVLSLNDLVVR